MKPLTFKVLEPEITFITSRSSGPGGQNVNKVSTKVTMRWNIAETKIATQEQKEILFKKLKNKLTQSGELILSSQESRSQSKNKDLVIRKLEELIHASFKKVKTRKATKPSKTATKHRLDSKKKHSDKKKLRMRIS